MWVRDVKKKKNETRLFEWHALPNMFDSSQDNRTWRLLATEAVELNSIE